MKRFLLGVAYTLLVEGVVWGAKKVLARKKKKVPLK